MVANSVIRNLDVCGIWHKTTYMVDIITNQRQVGMMGNLSSFIGTFRLYTENSNQFKHLPSHPVCNAKVLCLIECLYHGM